MQQRQSTQFGQLSLILNRMLSDYRAELGLFLKQFQLTNQLTLLFVCESGSRAHGTASTFSDHDLKGIFWAKTGQEKLHRLTNQSWKGVKGKIDYQFIGRRRFIQQLQKDNCVYLRWLLSGFVILDSTSGQLQRVIAADFSFPVGEVEERVSKDLAKLQGDEPRPAKKVLNMVVDSMLLLCSKSRPQFPPMPIDELFEMTQLAGQFDQLEEVRQLVQQIMFMKKNGKGLTAIAVPEAAIKMAKLSLQMKHLGRRDREQALSGLRSISKLLGV